MVLLPYYIIYTINKSLIVSSLIIDFLVIGPLRADSLVAESLALGLSGSFSLLGLPTPLLVLYIAT
jgi:hypothetical protein